MKKLSLALALISLVFCVACGSNGIGGLIGNGHFSNTSLKGNYVYQITGWDFSSGSPVPYQEAGVFAANGSGTITSGTDDFTEESSGGVGTSTDSGTYSIASDGTGTLTLNFSGGGSLTLDLTMASPSKVYMIEADDLNATGLAELQSSTTLPTSATSFVFKQHSVSATQDFSTVGQITIAADGSVTGSDDINRSGTINGGNGTTSPLTLTSGSSFAAPTANGRGTATIIDSTGTTDFVYYIVDSNNFRFLVSDVGVVGAGRAEAQSGAPFTTDPLSGNSYAFGSRADDNYSIGGVNTVGSFSASSGAISGGLLDSAVDAATSYADVPINSGGAYTPVTTSGRTVVTFSTGIPSNVTQVFWMVNPSRAFFLTFIDSIDISKIEDGTADEQQGTFTNSSLNGQYAFSMDGFDANAGVYVDRVGWIQWNGSGSLTWNEAVNDSGSISSPGALSGTYAVGTNGRAAATVNSLSYNNDDIVFYLVSGTNAYILENDPGVEINGTMTQQSQ
jgi:hypothetical protein